MWRAVRELYLRDQVVEAYREAENLGGQDSNDLFAESEVREKGLQTQVRSWLTIEGIADELPSPIEPIFEFIAQTCEDLSRRFGWDHRESTMISFLPVETDEPWMPGRWGYFVDKVPYDKICMPTRLAFNSLELRATTQHEFMHAITLNLTNGHESRWLSEALSMYAENRNSNRQWNRWRQGLDAWMSPHEANILIATDSRNAAQRPLIALAYAQAHAVAKYLVHVGGEMKLGRFLRTVGNESFGFNLRSRLLGHNRVDAALRAKYRMSEAEAFRRTYDWVMSGHTD